MSENYILVINVALYAIPLCIFTKYYGASSLSVPLFAFYLFSSIASLIYYESPFLATFTANGEISIQGILYLFLANFLICSSFRNFKLPRNGFYIINCNKKVIYLAQYGIFIVTLIIFLSSLGGIRQVLGGGSDLSDLRNETWEVGAIGSKSFVISLFSRAFGACSPLLLFIAICNICLFKEKRWINYFSIVLYFLDKFGIIVTYVSRATIVLMLFELFLIFYMLWAYINPTLKKQVVWILVMVSMFVVPFFFAINNSRFSGNQNDAGIGSVLRYAGEAQLNFSGLMFGHTTGISYGYRVFPLFRRVMGLRYYGDEGTNNQQDTEYLDKLNPNAPNYVFYQLAGAYYLEFGAIGSLILFGLFNIVFNYRVKIMSKRAHFSYMTLCFAWVISVWFGFGIFYPLYGNEAGNLLIVYLLLLSIFFSGLHVRKLVQAPSSGSFKAAE